MEFLEKNWALVAANPLPFFALVVIVAGFMWTVASIYYSGQVATAKGEAVLAEKQRDDFKNKLSVSSPDEAKTKVDRLEGELAGLNRIISVTIGYPWKALTDQQINELSERLVQLQKHRVQIMYANQLGRDLAQSFYRASRKQIGRAQHFQTGAAHILALLPAREPTRLAC